MAFEALNDAGRSPNNLIVVLMIMKCQFEKCRRAFSLFEQNSNRTLLFKVKEDIDIILNKIPAIGKARSKHLAGSKAP